MLQDSQDLPVAWYLRLMLVVHFSKISSRLDEKQETHHLTSVRLEVLPSIRPAEVYVEDHLLVVEVSIKIAGALEVGHWRPKFGQVGICGLVADRTWDLVSFKGPHLHSLRCPQHREGAAACCVERCAREAVGLYGAADVGVCVLEMRLVIADCDASLWDVRTAQSGV